MIKRLRAGAVKLILLFLLISCARENPVEPGGTVNMEQIESAYTSARKMTGLKSLVVQHKGEIIKEEYFNGSSSETASDIRSVTKSVVALLIGIAIDKGGIPSTDDYIGNYLKNMVEYYPPDKKEITIQHLLTMSGGFQGNELTEPDLYQEWNTSSNQVEYILDVPIDHMPGEHFSYDSRPLSSSFGNTSPRVRNKRGTIR